MEPNDNNATPNNQNKQPFDLFQHLEVGYSKDKEEVWKKLSEKMTATETPKIKNIWLPKVAAAAILIISGLSFMRFYTTHITVEAGQQLAYALPDGSEVKINAASKISYAPYWWYFNRQVQLEGEAFFEVKKGSRFKVQSELGLTEVLGTSFNIYTRENQYEVFCATGSVKVTAQNEVILSPNQLASLKDGKLIKTEDIAKQTAASWLENVFHFESTPIQQVLKELSIQYGVSIIATSEQINKLSYTGHFNKTESIEDALELICISFNLKFVKTPSNTYEIMPI